MIKNLIKSTNDKSEVKLAEKICQWEVSEELADEMIKIIKNLEKKDNITVNEDFIIFGQCVGLQCIHHCAEINPNWVQKSVLNKLFNDFLRTLESNKSSDFDKPEIVVESECLMDFLNLLNSLLNTRKFSSYVLLWVRKFSPIYIDISLSVVDNDNKYKKIARDILVRLIVLSYNDSINEAHKFIRALCQLETLEDGEDLNDKLQIRLALDGINLEIAVIIDTTISASSVDKEMLVLEEIIDIINALPKLVKDDLVNLLLTTLVEARLSNNTATCSVQPELVIDHSEQEHFMKVLCLFYNKMKDQYYIIPQRFIKFAINNIDVIEKDQQIGEFILTLIKLVLNNIYIMPQIKQLLNQFFLLLSSLVGKDYCCIDLIIDLCSEIVVNKYIDSPPMPKVHSYSEDLLQAVCFFYHSDMTIFASGLELFADILDEQHPEHKYIHPFRMEIYKIFSHYIFHSDWKIYSPAIRGLSLLLDHDVSKFLPVISRKLVTDLTDEQKLIIDKAYRLILEILIK